MTWRRRGSLALLSSLFACAPAGAGVLFDASLGTTPGSQGWVFGAQPLFGHSVTETPGVSFTTLDTTSPRTDKGGYFSVDPVFGVISHPGFPAVLDRSSGFSCTVRLRVDAESHIARDDNSDGVGDRAGFSIVVVSEDLMGIELGFWEDEVWAYEDDIGGPDEFTHAEGVAIDTTLAERWYSVSILGSSYTLLADGVPVLAGPLRDYSAFAGSPNVYAIPSFMFFGDDTGSAESRTEISFVESSENVYRQCGADVDANGTIDAGDVTFVIFRLGDTGVPGLVPGDANTDGVVDVGDITFVVFKLGSPCPA